MAPRRATPRPGPDPGPAPHLGHLMLVGGTAEEWDAFDDTAWEARIARLVEVAQAVGAPWVTVRPIGRAARGDAADSSSTAPADVRTYRRGAGGDEVTVVVDPEPDARTRFARALEMLAAEGASPDEITEARLARMLCHAPDEPDLAVILGPSDHLPTSVSWELAYAEMVFLDVDWAALNAAHLREAVDQFRHRDRRFGGVET